MKIYAFPSISGTCQDTFLRHKAERLLTSMSGGGRTDVMSKSDWHNGRRVLNNWSGLRKDFACENSREVRENYPERPKKFLWKTPENSSESMKNSGTLRKTRQISQWFYDNWDFHSENSGKFKSACLLWSKKPSRRTTNINFDFFLAEKFLMLQHFLRHD